MKEQIKELCDKFFNLSWVVVDSLDIICEDSTKNIFFIKLETPDSKIIIWTHGQTLDNIKHLLSRMIENSIWKNFTIHVEVNDYLKLKDEKLYNYIDWRIDYLMKNNKSIILPNFSPYERKKIHNYISTKNIDWLKTYSEWEWKERFMHMSYSWPIKPQSQNKSTSTSSNPTPSFTKSRPRTIDIDIDWIDI